jgi:hypothetical protein
MLGEGEMKPLVMTGAEVRTLMSNTTGLNIPVIAARGLVFSGWMPSPEDLKQLAAGEPLWLVQRGQHIPEMHMIVGRKEAVIPAPIKTEAAQMRSPEVQRRAKVEMLTRKYEGYVRAALLTLIVYATLVVSYWVGSHLGDLPPLPPPLPLPVQAYPIR